ncbi:MAG: rubredoxin reductase [Cellvibrionales bacterium TMED79]|jgi:rubredoxin-NAD+ reductase|nr:rubredoxin reductase [Halieaceae bacterium]OUV06210.1 MAG: rubredoxin reductase [Cellvibrionales bacterium TMED79]
MAQWECIVCGLIYDEKEGWPDDGIAPGTKWADVPDDWTCPDCGVGKDDFELIPGTDDEADSEDAPASSDNGPSDHPIVVVGSGLAAYGLANAIKKTDAEAAITLITRDGGENYSKPMISTGFTKKFTPEQLATQTAQNMSDNLGVTVRTRTEVASLDTTASEVVLTTGERVPYSSLVLTLGAELIRPPMGGDAADEVMGVNDLDDYRRFRETLASTGGNKVAVIGAGLIGCEFTNDLLNGGYAVEAVDPMNYCLPTLLPETAGRAVQSALEAKGATFHFGPLATDVNKTADGYSVALNNGQSIEADAVLSAVGVRPRTQLAADAGIECGRGVKTDKFLRTNVDNVYAIGDCAEVEGHVLVYVAPLMAAARALAATLTGTPTEVAYPAMPVTIKTPACPVCVSPVARDAEGEWTIEADGQDVKALFHSPEGELLGFALTGQAVKERMPLTKQLPPIL